MKPHRKNFENPKGFTLIEVMLALVIGSILIAGAMSTFMLFTNMSYALTVQSDYSREFSTAQEIISNDARQAKTYKIGDYVDGEFFEDILTITPRSGNEIVYALSDDPNSTSNTRILTRSQDDRTKKVIHNVSALNLSQTSTSEVTMNIDLSKKIARARTADRSFELYFTARD